MTREIQVTSGPGGRILTNTAVWSPDGQWIVYDTRSDAAGEVFDGTRIEMVNVRTREVRELYRSKNGACCGVATWHPRESRVAFILGPEHPTPDWSYGPAHRQGVLVRADKPGIAINLDARDLVPPYTPGALRGGSHVHVFSPDGEWVSFTYDDAVLERHTEESSDREMNLRNVGVAVPAGAVRVSGKHTRNHDGTYFSVLVTRTTARPKPGSDEIAKAFEEAWVGTNGYRTRDGRRQKRALAFQGHVVLATGQTIAEVFLVDLPDDLRIPGEGPLQGTPTRRPRPPQGVRQRRLTYTQNRKYPGLQGTRHWLRSSPDGTRVGFLMKDDGGVPQFWTVSPNGGEPVQVTKLAGGIDSAFTWSPDWARVVFVSDNRIASCSVATGQVSYHTDAVKDDRQIRPEACVHHPSGQQVAFVVRHGVGKNGTNQIHIVNVQT